MLADVHLKISLQSLVVVSKEPKRDGDRRSFGDCEQRTILLRGKKQYVHSMPFASTFLEILEQLSPFVHLTVFSTWAPETVDQICEAFRWQMATCRVPPREEASSLGEAFHTLASLGVPEVSYAKTLIVDVNKSSWHPLVHAHVIECNPIECTLGLLIALSKVFSVFTLAKASASMMAVTASRRHLEQNLFRNCRFAIPPSLGDQRDEIAMLVLAHGGVIVHHNDHPTHIICVPVGGKRVLYVEMLTFVRSFGGEPLWLVLAIPIAPKNA